MDSDAYAKNNKPEKGGQPGIYGHPMTSDKLHATNFPQADALIRQGWFWEKELPKYEQPTETPVVNVNAVAEVESLKAQLAVAEAARDAALAQAKVNRQNEDAENKQAAKDTLDREAARTEQEEARTKNQEKVAEANKALGASNAKKGDK